MSCFVLVAGAGIGAWGFRKLARELRERRHDVFPISLTGTGDRAHLARPDLDVTSWATDVTAVLESEELSDVTLVGHSFAGTVISQVSHSARHRLSGLVFLDAIVPVDGLSVFDMLGGEATRFIEGLVAQHDGWSLPWFTDEQLAALYPGHGLSTAQLRWIRQHVTAQPIATYRQSLLAPRTDLPKTYLRCTRTPPVANLDLVRGWDVRDLDAGHWAFITAQRLVADALTTSRK